MGRNFRGNPKANNKTPLSTNCRHNKHLNLRKERATWTVSINISWQMLRVSRYGNVDNSYSIKQISKRVPTSLCQVSFNDRICVDEKRNVMQIKKNPTSSKFYSLKKFKYRQTYPAPTSNSITAAISEFSIETRCTFGFQIQLTLNYTVGVRGGAVGWGTALQVGRARVRFPIGIFHWHNPSGSTMVLGLTQPPTLMSTRNISWG
jgi:hypothetical protein